MHLNNTGRKPITITFSYPKQRSNVMHSVVWRTCSSNEAGREEWNDGEGSEQRSKEEVSKDTHWDESDGETVYH